MPTLLEIPSLRETVELAKSLGLDFIELNQNLPAFQNEVLDADELNSLSGEFGIFFTLHIDEQMDVCNFNRRIADAWLESFADSLRAAQAIGAPIVNMHLADGVYFTLPNEKVYLYSKHEAHFTERIEKLIETAERELSGCGILVCIENTNGWMPFQIRGIEKLLQSGRFALTLDIGHSAVQNKIDEPFILKSGRLKHMHIHDASEKSNHLPFGSGELDLSHYFNIAQQNSCRAVIEVKTVDALRHSVKFARDHGLI